VIRGVLRVLAYIHRMNVVHRDLKPENIMVRRKEAHQAIDAPSPKQKGAQVVLIDFGFAADIESNKPALLKRCGTVGYIAPECLKRADLDPVPSPKADIYSAGIILYEMIYGINPFLADPSIPRKEALQNNRKGKVEFNVKPIVHDFPESRHMVTSY